MKKITLFLSIVLLSLGGLFFSSQTTQAVISNVSPGCANICFLDCWQTGDTPCPLFPTGRMGSPCFSQFSVFLNSPSVYDSITKVKTVCMPNGYLNISGTVFVVACDNNADATMPLRVSVKPPNGNFTEIGTISATGIQVNQSSAFSGGLDFPSNLYNGPGVYDVKVVASLNIAIKATTCTWTETNEYTRQIYVSDCPCSSSGATAKYSFNNGNAVDDFGNGYNGTVSGATYSSTGGYDGKGAYAFDGTNDYITLGSIAAFNTPSKTIAFWAKPAADITASQMIFSLSGANYYVGFGSSNRMLISYKDSGNVQKTIYSDNNAVITGAWHYYTYTFSVSGTTATDTVTTNMYVDGVFKKTNATATGYSTTYGTTAIIGAYVTTGTLYFFNGSIDNLEFYNRTFTDSEVAGSLVEKDPSGSGICAKATTSTLTVDTACPTGSALDPSGSGVCSKATTSTLTVDTTCPTGSALDPSGSGICSKATTSTLTVDTACPTGSALDPSGSGICSKANTSTLTVATACPTGSALDPSGSGICAKATTSAPNIGTSCPTGSALDPSGSGICATATILTFLPPQAAGLTTGAGYCTEQGRQITFQWTYSGSNLQTKFDFQVDNNSDFSSPEVNRTLPGLSNPSGTINVQYVYVRAVPTGDDLAYSTTYYWRVKVYDANGNSGWLYPPGTSTSPGTPFTTASHAYPFPSFSFSPLKPTPGQNITFTDSSQCYGVSCTYAWDFDNNGTTDSTTAGTVTHSYPNPGTYTVKLGLTDNLGYYCSYTNPITVSSPGQKFEWKEIAP